MRYEFKYLLNPIQEQALRSAVSHFMVPDPSAQKRGGSYPVTSLYFDTLQLADYYDKSGGYLIRKKLRARIYEPSLRTETPEIWLEIKQKYDMAFQKVRYQISAHDWNLLMNHQYTTLLSTPQNMKDVEVLHQFIWFLLQEGRRPAFFIRYKRWPYRDPHSDLRITFDSNLEAYKRDSLEEPQFPRRIRHNTIMEVKYSKDALPAWLSHVVRVYDLSRTSFSKYGVSVERLRSYNTLPR